VFIANTTPSVNAQSGAFRVAGGLSVLNSAYVGDNMAVQGNVRVNDIDITPNLNDIIQDKQATLTPDQREFVNVENLYFENSKASSFKAYVNVQVTGGSEKHALWEINGVLKNDSWVIASSFTGELTGVQFRIVDDAGFGRIQYTNSNAEGTVTIARFRAQTTAPAGTNPTYGETVIQNSTMNFVQNGLLYANTTDTVASATDIIIETNKFDIGQSRVMGVLNTVDATNLTTGAMYVLGGVAVSKNLLVGADVNVTGTLYSNGTSVFSDQRVKTNVVDIPPSESLEKLLALRVKRYNFDEDFSRRTGRGTRDKIGFLAQEVGEIIPEAITKQKLELGDFVIEDFNYLNHDSIYSVAVGAIQALNEKVEQLQKELDELKKQ
jgi:hypothetical protein